MGNYYNENEPFAARWLRNLIIAGELSRGEVDERSIREIQGADLAGIRRAHFFAGIGGWDLALQLAGWPEAREVWTGSCPCQPFSVASLLRKGVADKRHLWPELRRIIAECRPATIFGEQVGSPAGRDWLAGVRADLEALGYRVGAADLCAAGVNAPHIRQRLYWVADRDGERLTERKKQDGSAQQSEQQALNRGDIGGRGHADRVSNDSRQRLNRRQAAGESKRRREFENSSSDDGLCHAQGATSRSSNRLCLGQSNSGNASRKDVGLRDAESQQTDSSIPEGFHPKSGGASGGDDWLRDPECLERPRLPGNNPWWPAEVRRWADGTTRRIEPGFSPLASRIPGRVGLLRGYGNAIVPQIAAEFIRAYLDAETLPTKDDLAR